MKNFNRRFAMKIHLINPNTSQHMTEQMQESAQAVANASTEIVGRTPKHGAVSIESHFDEAMSIVGVAEEVRKLALSIANKKTGDATYNRENPYSSLNKKSDSILWGSIWFFSFF